MAKILNELFVQFDIYKTFYVDEGRISINAHKLKRGLLFIENEWNVFLFRLKIS